MYTILAVLFDLHSYFPYIYLYYLIWPIRIHLFVKPISEGLLFFFEFLLEASSSQHSFLLNFWLLKILFILCLVVTFSLFWINIHLPYSSIRNVSFSHFILPSEQHHGHLQGWQNLVHHSVAVRERGQRGLHPFSWTLAAQLREGLHLYLKGQKLQHFFTPTSWVQLQRAVGNQAQTGLRLQLWNDECIFLWRQPRGYRSRQSAHYRWQSKDHEI